MVRLRCHSRKMDPFGNDEIARLLRLKRYEQPPASYYENFLSEFRRCQRDELLRQPVCGVFASSAHTASRSETMSVPTCRRRGSGGVRCSNFNQDFSATRHYSVRSPELAGSNQVTKYRKRIGFRASGVDSAFRHAAGCSPCKQQGYSDAAVAAG
jgi:hypothetical protein